MGSLAGLLVAWWTASSAVLAQAPESRPERTTPAAAFPMPHIAVEELPVELQVKVLKVLERPTLHSRGPAEAFHCQPAVYYWLVDHPDQAVRMWRAMGARCAPIEAQGEGAFRWHDPQAGEIRWYAVAQNQQQHIWYAEGRVRPSPLLPATGVQAVVVLQCAEGNDEEGRPAMRHQIDLMVHTDSRALSLAARLFGESVPRAAEQYIGQMEMFFGGLAWYLCEYPQRAQALYDRFGISPGR
jgi:hypothetical protein